ncbi:hypothetical protein AJ79_07882 [Helicocarpus griseus UAMH5409]|uniref:Ribosomal protein L22 n=1 Tax=Helicocarpus griseus UAMH5409 TaxID=1447875 RepID=A0A2B7WXX8_9EURO|nr:hypothetical protein AJ79_07882 [Helicocarpus griseus UAMH5409]
MAAACAAFTSRQLSRAAGPRLPTTTTTTTTAASLYLSRRTFTTTSLLRATPSLSKSLPSPSTTTSTTTSKPKNDHLKVNQSAAPKINRGSLAPGSIFAEDDEIVPSPIISPDGRKPQRRPTKETTDDDAAADSAPTSNPPLSERDLGNVERALVPFPNRRARWERKMVIRAIRKRGRLTRREEIARTERESLAKSHFFKTSVKKLMMVARQIAGKNIDDAILQMRFSPKKVAKDVREHLEHARNEAIVVHGMGLGRDKVDAETAAAVEDQGVTAAPSKASPLTITLKDGTKKTITDRSAIYIAQAWVGRGTFGRDLDHRARGAINLLKLPHTSLTVVLKEEKSRIREWEERKAKEERKRRSRLWVPLMDRKIYGQRQWYSW